MNDSKGFNISSLNTVTTNGITINQNVSVTLDDNLIGVIPVSVIEKELQKCFAETIKDLTYKATYNQKRQESGYARM